MGVVARVRWAEVGAGGHVSRRTSAWWERAVAAPEGRAPQVLVHAVLEIVEDGTARTIDMSPTWGRAAGRRRVMSVGAVGSRRLGWCPLFRYELRVVDDVGSPPAPEPGPDPAAAGRTEHHTTPTARAAAFNDDPCTTSSTTRATTASSTRPPRTTTTSSVVAMTV